MYNFRFHLVTVVGIFLALALGIFIGSTFTEEGIIIQQRGTIERMRQDIDALQSERREMRAQAEGQAETIVLLQDWLGDMQELYWQANPIAKTAVLIHDSNFNPEYLGPYLTANVVKVHVAVENGNPAQAGALAQAIISGDGNSLACLEEGIFVAGDLVVPDCVFLALDPNDKAELARDLTAAFLETELPVVALGNTGWDGLADLANHPLFNSVSHLDTPLGLYCLGSILRGQGGHFGPDNLLPAREAGGR